MYIVCNNYSTIITTTLLPVLSIVITIMCTVCTSCTQVCICAVSVAVYLVMPVYLSS